MSKYNGWKQSCENIEITYLFTLSFADVQAVLARWKLNLLKILYVEYENSGLEISIEKRNILLKQINTFKYLQMIDRGCGWNWNRKFDLKSSKYIIR